MMINVLLNFNGSQLLLLINYNCTDFSHVSSQLYLLKEVIPFGKN